MTESNTTETTKTPQELRSFRKGVIIASMLMGVAGGVLPFFVGVLPGGLSGYLVGRTWARIMVRHVQRRGRAALHVATAWGGVMGFLSALFVHWTVFISISALMVFGCIDDGGYDGFLFVQSIAVVIGLPTGLAAGLILGGVCGLVLKRRIEHVQVDGSDQLESACVDVDDAK